MIQAITEKELLFMESLYDPICVSECLFSNFDSLSLMEEDKFSHIRLGQLPLLSYEYMIDKDPNLSEKENFKLKEGAGNIWCLGGRRYGKTLCIKKLDLLMSMIHLKGEWVGFCSYDQIHIRGVLEPIIQVLEIHPFFEMFKAKINRSPNYKIALINGYLLESVNMNLHGKKGAGSQFFQKHFSRLYIEEGSFETEEVFKKRRDSVSENGCVFRISGMTNFTKHSPCGRVFYDLKKKAWICNLPQYVNPKWDENEREKAIKDLGGEDSINYRIFVKGEVVEEGISVFYMEKVRQCYPDDDKKIIKHFEINKNNFNNYEGILIVERAANADNVYIDADIGESAPTEIIVLFEINNIYKYTYNITLHNLINKEQAELLKWLIGRLEANFIGIDCGEGTGRAIYYSLEEEFPKEQLTWYDGNLKIITGFSKDFDGNVIFDGGEPVTKEECMAEWSVLRLKTLFYDKRMYIPIDYKFDKQFNSVMAVKSGNRTIYGCAGTEDHIFDAFKVFAINQWFNEFNTSQPLKRKKACKIGVW